MDPSEIVLNILGFMPVGIVLAQKGTLRATILAALLSAFAETAQTIMVFRDPSVIDWVSNTAGGAIGAAICNRWNWHLSILRITKRVGLVSGVSAIVLVAGYWASSDEPVSEPNVRGSTAPGTLEGYWKLDEKGGELAFDSSGRGINGRLNHSARSIPGIRDGALKFDGPADYISIGRTGSLRLVGSMTITAWINSTTYPSDDAAIVSKLSKDGVGYQLDTTIDSGPRTIGFKISDSCGVLVARYGATPLAAGRWYHVAGVYDAKARTMDVYLNGVLDDGEQRGEVQGAQRGALVPAYIGRRSTLRGFEFAGFLDDVRLYSYALTASEIKAAMNEQPSELMTAPLRKERDAGGGGSAPAGAEGSFCTGRTDDSARMDTLAGVAVGTLVGIACLGLWPARRSLVSLVISCAAGIPLAWALAAIPWWEVLLLSLAGGAAVTTSIVSRKN